MITHKILYQNLGEVRSTLKTPVAVFTGQVDLEETDMFLLSESDHRLIEDKKYTVHEIELPEWLDANEWIQDSRDWQSTLHGFGSPQPEVVLRWAVTLETEQRIAVQELYTKKIRSPFKKSLKAQIEAWAEASERKYQSPLSAKQLHTLWISYDQGQRPWAYR